MSLRYRNIQTNLFSSDGIAISVPSKSKNAAIPPFFSSASFTPLTSSRVITSPPAQSSSRHASVERYPINTTILPPTLAIPAANKTPPSSRSTHARPREPTNANPRSFLPATPQAHASMPTPTPSNKNIDTSSRHTDRGSSATPPARGPTKSRASPSRPSRSGLPAWPAPAENPSPLPAQKRKRAATTTPFRQQR